MLHWLVLELCNASLSGPVSSLQKAYTSQLSFIPASTNAATTDSQSSPGPHALGDITMINVLESPSSSKGNPPKRSSTKSSALRSTFLGSGAIRLYYTKSGDNASESDLVPNNDSDASATSSVQDGTLLAILALPSYFLPTDLIEFIGQETCDSLVHVRMIQSSATPEKSLVLLKFKTRSSASYFYSNYNLRPFNSLESHVCHVIKVDRLVVSGSIPEKTRLLEELEQRVTSLSVAASGPSSSSGPSTYTSSSSSIVELPTCPVCLERMDSNATGLLTIPCQHTFHCTCLAQWPDSSCPVCRHGKIDVPSEPVQSHSCCQCPSLTNLWVCIICGSIGCGRYDNKHAFAHFKETGHCFAMDLNSQRIWDYSSDSYVHRLLQNEVDGKIVELPPPELKQMKSDKEDLAEQYTYLLSSQLESQRDYYESLLSSARSRVSALEKENKTSTDELAKFTDKCNLFEKQNIALENRLGPLEKQLDQIRKENAKTQQSLAKALSAHAEEKELTSSLVTKLELSQKTQANLEKTCEDLQEQVRDLLFYLDARQKLAGADDDITEGTVVLPQQQQATSSSSSSTKKKKKKK